VIPAMGARNTAFGIASEPMLMRELSEAARIKR
jgi:hypothetical protein